MSTFEPYSCKVGLSSVFFMLGNSIHAFRIITSRV